MDGRHARPDPGSGLPGAALHRSGLARDRHRGDIDQVLLAAAVSGANGKSYFEEPGNRVGIGSSHSLPDLIVVPRSTPARPPQDLTLPENATRLQAEIRRRFEAAGAVNAG